MSLSLFRPAKFIWNMSWFFLQMLNCFLQQLMLINCAKIDFIRIIHLSTHFLWRQSQPICTFSCTSVFILIFINPQYTVLHIWSHCTSYSFYFIICSLFILTYIYIYILLCYVSLFYCFLFVFVFLYIFFVFFTKIKYILRIFCIPRTTSLELYFLCKDHMYIFIF